MASRMKWVRIQSQEVFSVIAFDNLLVAGATICWSQFCCVFSDKVSGGPGTIRGLLRPAVILSANQTDIWEWTRALFKLRQSTRSIFISAFILRFATCLLIVYQLHPREQDLFLNIVPTPPPRCFSLPRIVGDEDVQALASTKMPSSTAGVWHLEALTHSDVSSECGHHLRPFTYILNYAFASF